MPWEMRFTGPNDGQKSLWTSDVSIVLRALALSDSGAQRMSVFAYVCFG